MMQIHITNAGDKTVMNLSGRFDFNAHRVFKAAYDPILGERNFKNLEIDLSDIEYLDSSALGMLMLLRERAMLIGITVVLAKPNKMVEQILDIANFKKLFTIS
ncbi:MAG: STAS domain-containing protein [Sideroxydans sp.]